MQPFWHYFGLLFIRMRKFSALLLVLFAATAFAQVGPKATFEKKGLVFKDVNEGDVLEFSYTFTNTGNSDLKLLSVKPTCGCTVAEYPKEFIKPGETKTIDVTFDTEGRPGYQAKGVNIETNGGPVSLVFEAYVTSKDGRKPE
jgi:hypothetical protein